MSMIGQRIQTFEIMVQKYINYTRRVAKNYGLNKMPNKTRNELFMA